MIVSGTSAYERYLPWRRYCEAGFWLLNAAVGIGFNSVTVLMDLRRSPAYDSVAPWEPVVWEGSSGLLWLAMVPVIARVSRHVSWSWDRWRHWGLTHLATSVVVSLCHVLGMVALRKVAYWVAGEHYDFGPWARELLYEYLKDVRSYLSILLIVEAYRLLMRRMQGEAHLLDRPDEGVPGDTTDRPQRFLVRKLRREFLINVVDIEWLQAAGNYVNLHVAQHDYLMRGTIGGVESQLDPDSFARIHRSYIVNLAWITLLEPLDAGEARVHLRDGQVLPCSRRYRAALRERLGAPA